MGTIGEVIKVITTLRSFPVYFADNFLDRKEFIVLELWNGAKFQIRPKTEDRGIFKEVWIQEVYTPEGFEIGEEDVVVDVGAHIGIFSVLASRLAKKGKVYAFEPVKENFGMLRHNIKISNAKNIIAINQAISAKKEQREIFIAQAPLTGVNSLYSNLVYPKGKIGKIEKVDATSLSDFAIEYGVEKIDFLKMDCEGAEYDILLNCPDNILRIISRITMEYHYLDDNRNLSILRRFLKMKGFKTVTRQDGDKLYARQN